MPLSTICTFVLALYCFQCWICSSQHVRSSEEAGVKHQNNISTGVYLNTSSNVTIRVGEQLQLNCTIGAVNLSKVQLSWYHGTQELTNLTRKLNNKTIQLVIEHVGWINNGSYTCRENNYGDRVQPESVMVRVGDIPGPPRDIWINNVEMRTYIHWKAPLHLGGLQLNYAVTGQCKNVSTELPECEKDSIPLCEVIGRERGSESDQFVCKVSAILHQFVTYIAFVEASNVLGSRKSDPVEFTVNLFNVLSTTPQPAIFLSPSAKEVAPPGTVKLTWKDARQQQPIEVEYTILYHKDGDRQNKSVTVKAPRTSVLISDLVGFSWYHFYLLVRYAKKGTTKYGIYSEATELTVRTRTSAPRKPVITNCSHWSNVSSDPGLTVTWTIPEAEYFNGPSKSATIFYRCQRGRQDISGNVTVRNSTVRSAVITAVKPSDACEVWIVWMELCNKPGLCSSSSNMCRTSGSLRDNASPGPRNSKNSVKGTVLISVAGAAGGLTLVIIIVVCYRRRNNKGRNTRRPLRNILVMPAVIHGYDEIEEPLENNNYDVINV